MYEIIMMMIDLDGEILMTRTLESGISTRNLCENLLSLRDMGQTNVILQCVFGG